jgi:hypothetical protein
MTRRPHRFAALAVLVAALAGASPASATKVTIDGHLTPVIRLFQPRPVPASLAIDLKFAGDDGGEPPVLQNAQVMFPYGANFNGKLFPACDPKALEAKGKKGCSAATKIGSGFAIGADPSGGIRQKVDVTLYNGAGGRSIVFYLLGNGDPLSFAIPFAGAFNTFSGGDWHYGLDVPVPPSLQRVAGIDISVEEFSVKVGATRRVKGRKRGIVEAIVCPPGTLVPVQGTFTFLDNPKVKQDSYIHCG